MSIIISIFFFLIQTKLSSNLCSFFFFFLHKNGNLRILRFRYGYLYSFITTAIPVYGAKVLGGDAIRNGIQVSIPWLICWITSIIAGITSMTLINANMVEKITMRKVYASIVLILSPLMLLGVMIAKCDEVTARVFMKISVVLLSFERSSVRINSLDLCPSECSVEINN